MFSHFVTAAKGLFARPNSEEASSIPSDSTPNNPKMVTATRQRNIPSREATAGSDANSTPVMNGKRKTRPANSGTADGQHKRRKRSSLEGPEAIENGDSGVEESEPTPKKKREGSPSKHNHVRFDSEEPDEPQGLQAEEIQEPQGNKNDSEDSSDDDAPEAIDNSAQMSRIKAESQKLQKVKQRCVSQLEVELESF